MTSALKSRLAMVVMALCALAAQAQPAPGYYTADLDGKNGRDLELALAAIVYPHTRISYDNLWKHFPVTDPAPADSLAADAPYTDLVYDMYAWMRLRPHYYSENDHTQTTGINREHAVPNSWWGGKDGNTEAYSDLHHLMPADGAANNKKSDNPLGTARNIVGATATNTTSSGCKLWSIPSERRGDFGDSPAVWEPTDEYKGDFARMYLYLACAYQGRLTWQDHYMFTNDAEGNTDILPWATEQLLEWHRADRVSDKERARNNAVEGIQGNRNPFIDYPELAEYIWGNSNDREFSLASAVSAYSDRYIYNLPDAWSGEIFFPHIAHLGQPFTPPTLTTNSDGALTFSSSNTSVATVDAATGAVTIVAPGYAVITVVQAATDTYKSGSASYLIQVLP